ncbi:MAG: hypothetical protein KGO50_17475 [Myxococcales bacterium]|nr:hypothetical protein [Myxococcales bacterium]
MISIKLTDAQVVLLNWDTRRPNKSGKGWREYWLTREDLAQVRDIVETLASGSDCVSSSKALLRKVERLSEVYQ